MARANDAKHWQSFWQQADSNHKTDTGIRDSALSHFWETFFDQRLTDRPPRAIRLLDLASGDGAATRQAWKAARKSGAKLLPCCLDISSAALNRVKRDIPDARTVVACAAQTGLPDACQDIVVSQFGLEYAGPQALAEASRLLAPGGTLALVQHRAGSAIDAQSAAAAEAIDRFLTSGVLPALARFFEAFDAQIRGRGHQAALNWARRDLDPRVRQVGDLLRERGPGVAAGMIYSLYRDMAQLCARANYQHPPAVIAWTGTAEAELRAFQRRMRDMVNAALDDEQWRDNIEQLTRCQLDIIHSGDLALSGGQPAAWVTVAQRPV